MSPTDSLGDTLTQKDANHKYDIIVFAWVATPFGSSQRRDLPDRHRTGCSLVTGAATTVTTPTPPSTRLSTDSSTTTDPNQEIADLNTADKQLSADAYTLPLYQKPLILAYNSKFGKHPRQRDVGRAALQHAGVGSSSTAS